jgi:hypothetical protein
MTNCRLNEITKTYFEILEKEGIPEKYVLDYRYEKGDVIVILLSGKEYKKKVKPFYVETAGDVRGGLVSGIRIPSTEPSVQRDWLQATQSGEEQSRDDS